MTVALVHVFFLRGGLSFPKCCIYLDLSDNVLWSYIYPFCLQSTTLQDLETGQFTRPQQFCGDIARERTGLAKSVAGSLNPSPRRKTSWKLSSQVDTVKL